MTTHNSNDQRFQKIEAWAAQQIALANELPSANPVRKIEIERETAGLAEQIAVQKSAGKKYKYSEIFGDTFQGEGNYTGVPTVWVRFWGCNFTCDGFGQTDPTNPASWILDHQTIDVSSIKRMEDLPVFNRGCDSSYSWSRKFAHLAHTGTAVEICDHLEEFL
jgi:hypothetical protein